jgi:hypothetical protein
MLRQLIAAFWALWPDRVEAHVNHPSVNFLYEGGSGRAAIHCARSRGDVGVTADPGLARVYHVLCEEVGLHGDVREALARRVFSDRLHFVLGGHPED